MVKLFKVTAKDLRLKQITVCTEENNDAKLFAISLSNMPIEELPSIRKMRVSRDVQVQHAEHFLQPEDQIAQDQGKTWFEYATGQHLSSRPVRAQSRVSLPCFEELAARATEVIRSREDALAVEEDEEQDEAASGADAEDDDLFGGLLDDRPTTPGAKKKVTAAPKASVGSLAASSSAKKKAKAKPVKMDDDDEDDDPSASAGVGPTFTELTRIDPQMCQVAIKHKSLTGNTNTTSFENLQVVQWLESPKSGRIITAVLSSV